MPHENHPAIVRRLKRADGHLQTIIEMIEEDRPCLEIAQQLQAVESAIESAKKALIHDHISNCLERPLKTTSSSGRALKEFKLIASVVTLTLVSLGRLFRGFGSQTWSRGRVWDRHCGFNYCMMAAFSSATLLKAPRRMRSPR